eukprot:3766785-Pyramimonas_sp.AAC.1
MSQFLNAPVRLCLPRRAGARGPPGAPGGPLPGCGRGWPGAFFLFPSGSARRWPDAFAGANEGHRSDPHARRGIAGWGAGERAVRLGRE